MASFWMRSSNNPSSGWITRSGVLFLWGFRTISFSLGKGPRCFTSGKISSRAAPLPRNPLTPSHLNTAASGLLFAKILAVCYFVHKQKYTVPAEIAVRLTWCWANELWLCSSLPSSWISIHHWIRDGAEPGRGPNGSTRRSWRSWGDIERQAGATRKVMGLSILGSILYNSQGGKSALNTP